MGRVQVQDLGVGRDYAKPPMACLQIRALAARIANEMTVTPSSPFEPGQNPCTTNGSGPSSPGVHGSCTSTEAHGNRNRSSGISSRNRNRNSLLELRISQLLPLESKARLDSPCALLLRS